MAQSSVQEYHGGEHLQLAKEAVPEFGKYYHNHIVRIELLSKSLTGFWVTFSLGLSNPGWHEMPLTRQICQQRWLDSIPCRIGYCCC